MQHVWPFHDRLLGQEDQGRKRHNGAQGKQQGGRNPSRPTTEIRGPNQGPRPPPAASGSNTRKNQGSEGNLQNLREPATKGNLQDAASSPNRFEVLAAMNKNEMAGTLGKADWNVAQPSKDKTEVANPTDTGTSTGSLPTAGTQRLFPILKKSRTRNHLGSYLMLKPPRR